MPTLGKWANVCGNFATMRAPFDRNSVGAAASLVKNLSPGTPRMGQCLFPIARQNRPSAARPVRNTQPLVLARGQHLLATFADRVLVEAGDDAAATRHGAFAVLVIVCLAGGALVRGQRLRLGRTAESDGNDGESEEQSGHKASR